MSKQIPTIILFEGGKETIRRPAISSVTGKVLMRFFFTKVRDIAFKTNSQFYEIS